MNLKPPLLQKQISSGDSSWMELFKAAVALHQQGVNGDKNAIQEACGLWEQMRTQVPGNTLVLAYYGSTLCLLGRDQVDPVQRSANVIRGLKLLDQAVTSEPNNFEIRVIRGNVCVNLPEMYFHRCDTAIEDCKYIIACYEKYPDSIPAELYFQFLYNLSIAYHNLGNGEASESVLKKLCLISEDPKYKVLLTPQTVQSPYGTDNFFFLLQPLPVLLEEGEKLFQKALAGGKVETQKAVDFFAKARVFHADNQLLKAYHADCMSLKGRVSSNTGEMFASAIKAMKEIDAAVTSEPENVKIRFIRANHSLRLPEMFFSRTATAIADLEYIGGRLKQDPELFSKEQTEEILFNLGRCYFRLGLNSEGEDVWQSLFRDCSKQTQDKITVHRQNSLPPDLGLDLSLTTKREEFYAQAKRLHDLGVSGNKAAAQKGLELWEKAYTANPTDAVAEGFYGSSLALIGRDSAEINLMFANGIKGLKHLNQALDREPDNWELHLLRAYLSYSLPEVFFHKTQQAIQDFQYLKNAYEHNKCLFAGELYEKIINDLQIARQRV